MAKKSGYRVTVKNGDYRYEYNQKTGQYDTKRENLVDEFDNLGDALFAFLEYAVDEYNEDKVTLAFVPAKKSK